MHFQKDCVNCKNDILIDLNVTRHLGLGFEWGAWQVSLKNTAYKAEMRCESRSLADSLNLSVLFVTRWPRLSNGVFNESCICPITYRQLHLFILLQSVFTSNCLLVGMQLQLLFGLVSSTNAFPFSMVKNYLLVLFR